MLNLFLGSKGFTPSEAMEWDPINNQFLKPFREKKQVISKLRPNGFDLRSQPIRSKPLKSKPLNFSLSLNK